MASLGSLGSLIVDLNANIAGFQSDLGRAERATKQAAAQMEAAFRGVGARIAGGLATAFAGIQFTSLIKGSIDAADKLQDLSNRIGGNVKTLSELKFAAEQSGTSFETLSRGLTIVSKNAAAAAGGNEAIAKAFDAIGVSVKDSAGALKSADGLLSDVAEQFTKFRDGPEKSALALKLFGKSGVELIPVLNEGKAGLKAFAEEAQRLGVALDGDTAAAAAKFNDTFDQVKSALQGVGTELARVFLPLLQQGAENLREFLVELRESGALDRFASAVASAGEALKLLGTYIAAAIAGNGLRALIGLFTSATGAAAGMAAATTLLNGAIARLGGPIGLLAGGLAVLVVDILDTNAAFKAAEDQMQASAKAAEDAAARLATVRARAASQDTNVNFGNQQFFEDERKSLDGVLRQAERLQEVLNAGRKPGVNANFYKNTAEDLKLLEAQFVRMGGSSEKFKAALDGAGDGAKKLTDSLKPAAPVLQDSAAAAKLTAAADKALADANREAAEAVRVLLDALKAQAAVEKEQLTAARDLAEARRQQSQNLSNILADQDRELAVLQASGVQREKLIALFRAQDQAAGTLGKSWNELTQAERDSLAVGLTTIQIGDEQIAQAQRQADALDELSRYWEQVGAAAADALGEFAVEALTNFDDIGDAFKDLASSLGDIIKRVVSDMISEFLRLKVVKPMLDGLFSGGGTASGTGGFGSILSSFFGGFNSTSGAPGGGVGSSFVGPLQQGQTTGGLLGGSGGFGSMLGNVGGLVGGLYGVYGAYRSGSVGSGALSGAAAGTAVLPGIGTIVGAVVGALAGLLGGPKTPDLRLGAIGLTRKPEGTFTTDLGNFSFGARGIEGAEKEFVKLVTEFDKTIAGIVGSFTGGSEQLDKVRAALAKFAVDLKGDAITAENLLGQRLSAILATFDADVQAFVGSVGTVEERAQRLADAAVIVAGVESGFVDSFTVLADILKDNQGKGEALADTYNRVVGSFALMDGVLKGLGLNTELARVAFIKFSANVVEALGGLDNAASIINRNLTAFLTPEEQRGIRISSAQSRLDSLSETAGIVGPITNDAFKDLFRRALAGEFGPEKTAAILSYGNALADLNDAVAEGVGAKPVAIAIDLKPLQDAQQSVFDALASFGQTDYERTSAAIREQYRQTAQTLYELASASGQLNETLPATGAALQLMVLQLEEARNGLQRTILRQLISQYGSDDNKPQREFTSELDLLQNGFRVAAKETENWAAQLEKLERLDAASSIARNLRSFFQDSELGFAQGLKAFGISTDVLKKLLKDLGVNFDDLLSASSIDGLGRAARLLGVSADELATMFNIDLSKLDPTRRAALNAAVGKPDAQTQTNDGLTNIKKSTDETTDAVEQSGATIARLLAELIRVQKGGSNKGPAFDPYAMAGVVP